MVRPRKRSAVSPTKELDDSAIEVNQNFISKLPDDILHDILSRVPLDAAARTMVLSKRWLTIFPTKPDLDMSNFSLGLYMRLDDSELAARLGQLSRSRKLESYLNGKMDTFVMSIVKQRVDADLTRFSFCGCLSSKGFNACVHKLLSLNVPDIDLVLILYSPLSLPDRFYSHRSVRHLKLQSVCPLRRPHLITEGPNLLLLSLSKVLVAETFHSLKSLWLDGVYFMDSHLLTCFFVSQNFPHLTLLFLHNCVGLEGANNTAPKPLVIQCKTLTEVHLNWLHFGAIKVHGENITIFNAQWCLGHGNSPSSLTLNTPRLEHFYWSGYGCPIEIIAPKPSLKATFRADINLSTIPSNMDSAMSFLEAFTNMTRSSLGPQTIEVLGILKLQRNPRLRLIKFNKVSCANITIVPHKMGTVGLGSFLAMCTNLSSITLNVDPEYSIMSNFLDYFEENLDEANFWRDELLPELQHFLVSIRELEVNLTRFDLAKESILAFLDFVMEHATNLERVKYIRHNKSFTYTPVRSG